ncbi:hypothetical protein BpHYR1_038337 [Brachionus plicatilis]|uniref:Uncharacterized protein n=1 Tax=Brachionus plicatilis TaxID=10195 RepID=A0A3M7RDS5_BRAPC|nr:hypothetical protein BpHYR1_038337 [Brachionus plicatilis]
MESCTSYLIIFLLVFINKVTSRCHLPDQWTGKWYQSNGIDLLNINKTNFMNRGICIEHNQDKFLFFEKHECYRCIFIMQKHLNVLQYRTSYCSEHSDFELNCQNLSPESELFTIYRDNSQAEKCPIDGMYAIQSSQNENRLFQSFPKKCEDKDSVIMQCSDQSMLKIHFGKCANMPNYVINCIAHWSEGNTNYLIGRVELNNQKSVYKCLAYMQSAQSYQRRALRNENFVDINVKNRNDESKDDVLQILISQDEFCRNIDNIIDDQFSFKFNKVIESPHLIASAHALMSTGSNFTRQQVLRRGSHFHTGCRFPRWLNKKWHDLKQTKSYSLNYRLDSLIITDDKNSLVINKFTCWHLKSRKSNHFQAVVKSLNACTSGFQCITINAKSDYVLEIKLGEISQDNRMLDCSSENYISQDFAYVDTNYGVKCPLKSGLYKRLSSQTINERSWRPARDQQKINEQEPCRFLTQSQSLQVGCVSHEQYSLRTKLCYPNNQENKDFSSVDSFAAKTTASYTQIESEINLVCLAFWEQDGNNVVVSRTMSNEILCSIWSFSEDKKNLKLLEIDSTCNYNKQSHSRVNYEFFFVHTCQSETSQFKSFIKSYIKNRALPKIALAWLSKLAYGFVTILLFKN